MHGSDALEPVRACLTFRDVAEDIAGATKDADEDLADKALSVPVGALDTVPAVINHGNGCRSEGVM